WVVRFVTTGVEKRIRAANLSSAPPEREPTPTLQSSGSKELEHYMLQSNWSAIYQLFHERFGVEGLNRLERGYAVKAAVEMTLSIVSKCFALLRSDPNGRLHCTPLHIAALQSSVEAAEVILRDSPQLVARTHKTSPSALCPLHIAILCGSNPVVELLLDGKANPNANLPGESDATPETDEMLCKHNEAREPVDFAPRDDMQQHAAKELCQLLLAYAAEPTQHDVMGNLLARVNNWDQTYRPREALPAWLLKVIRLADTDAASGAGCQTVAGSPKGSHTLPMGFEISEDRRYQKDFLLNKGEQSSDADADPWEEDETPTASKNLEAFAGIPTPTAVGSEEKGSEARVLQEEVERLKAALDESQKRCTELEPLARQLQHSQEKVEMLEQAARNQQQVFQAQMELMDNVRSQHQTWEDVNITEFHQHVLITNCVCAARSKIGNWSIDILGHALKEIRERSEAERQLLAERAKAEAEVRIREVQHEASLKQRDAELRLAELQAQLQQASQEAQQAATEVAMSPCGCGSINQPSIPGEMAPRYVSADTPVEHVRVYVDGLQGQLRSRALRAAERINKRPPTLGKLDADLNAVADELGDEAIVEVTAGPRKGIICVTLRPEHGGHLTAGAGRGGRDVMLPGSALSFKLDGTPAAARGPPPLRVSAQGEWNLGQDGLGCCLTVAPLFGTGAWRLLPSVEMGAGLGGLFGLICPKSQHSYLQVCLTDPLGRHKTRLRASSRDLRQDASLLDVPLQSSKASVSHQFLNSYGQEDDGGQLGASCEVAGLLGDVQVARAEAAWARWGSGLGAAWQVSASAALASPLNAATIPWEERLFLGGVTGQGPGERLLGFGPHGLGPAKRKERETEAPRFGLVNGLGGLRTYTTSEPTRIETGQTTFLGGDTRASVEGSMRWPVPVGFGLHVFVFGSAGILLERMMPRKGIVNRFEDQRNDARVEDLQGELSRLEEICQQERTANSDATRAYQANGAFILSSIEQELQRLQSSDRDQEQERRALKQKLAQLQDEVGALHSSKREAEDRCKQLQVEVQQAENTVNAKALQLESQLKDSELQQVQALDEARAEAESCLRRAEAAEARLSAGIMRTTTKVTNLSAQLTQLEARFMEEQLIRKKYHNQIQDMKGNIRVFCRFRPLGKREQENGDIPVLHKAGVLLDPVALCLELLLLEEEERA
ncbi:KIN14E, partial [Symbiodinium sp. KB8]